MGERLDNLDEGSPDLITHLFLNPRGQPGIPNPLYLFFMGNLLLLILAVIPGLDVLVLGPAIGAVPLDEVLFRHPMESGFGPGRYSRYMSLQETRLIESRYAHLMAKWAFHG